MESPTTNRRSLELVAVVWLVALPWVISAGRELRWDRGVSDVVVCIIGFWVMLPSGIALILDARPRRPLVATSLYFAVDAVPFVALAAATLIWGGLTAASEVAASLLVAWAVTGALGAVFGWAAVGLTVAAARWEPSDAFGAVWQWRARVWWSAALVTTGISLLSAPLVLWLDDVIGSVALAMIVATGLLHWVVGSVSVDRRVLLWEVALSIPVVVAAVAVQDLNRFAIAVVGVASAAVFAAVVSRPSSMADGASLQRRSLWLTEALLALLVLGAGACGSSDSLTRSASTTASVVSTGTSTASIDRVASASSSVSSSTAKVGGAGPTDAKTITYEVHHAMASLTGEATVSYTDAGGATVKTTVSTPWESEPIAVVPGRSYRVEATTAPHESSHFYCGVHTDTGWNAGDSSPGGTCSYTFPDDVDQ